MKTIKEVLYDIINKKGCLEVKHVGFHDLGGEKVYEVEDLGIYIVNMNRCGVPDWNWLSPANDMDGEPGSSTRLPIMIYSGGDEVVDE